MNSDISGLPKDPLSSTYPPTTTPLEGEVTAEQVTLSVDTLVYEGTDTISATILTDQQLLGKSYEASSQIPMLLQPDPDGQTGPQPYGVAEQRLVKKDFAKHVKEQIAKSGLSSEKAKELFQALMSGKVPADPQLADLAKNIGQKATKETREESHLPESWTPYSTNFQDWVPLPIEPYDAQQQTEINATYDKNLEEALNSTIAQAQPPLTPAQITLLRTAISTGKVNVEIATLFNTITKTAATATQQAYGLSETWFKATPNVDDWKPINLGVVTPSAVNNERGEFVLTNIKDLLADLEKAGVKVQADLPPNDPNNLTLGDYTKAISNAIRELKAVLQDIQMADAEKTKAGQQLKVDALEAHEKKVDEEIQKRKEAEKKQKHAEKVSKIMKIVGPIIAVVATVVGAALAIFTFGASTALIVAGIAVGVAMTAYSIVDSATGCTTKIVEAVNKGMEKMFPDNPVLQKLMKALITAAVVAACITAIVLSGGGAAGAAAGSFASQVAKEVIKQMAVQVLIMSIMASNSIPEVLGVILKAAGVNEKDSQIAQIIMMVITMLLVMLATALGKEGLSNAAKGITEGAKDAASALSQLPGKALSALKGIGSTIKQGVTAEQASIQEGLKVAIDQVIKLSQKALNELINLPGTVGQAARQTSDGFIEIFVSMRRAMKTMFEVAVKGKQLTEDMRESISSGLRGTQKVLQLTPQAINAADGITRGIMGIQIAKLLKEIGNVKEAEDLLQAIIQMLEKILQSIQTGIDNRSSLLTSLQKSFTHFYDGIDRASGKINQPFQI